MAAEHMRKTVYKGHYRGATFANLNLEQLYSHLNEADPDEIGTAYIKSLRLVIRIRKFEASQPDTPALLMPYDVPRVNPVAPRGTPIDDASIPDSTIRFMVLEAKLRPEQRECFLDEYVRRKLADKLPQGFVSPPKPPKHPVYDDPAFEMSQMVEPDEPESSEDE